MPTPPPPRANDVKVPKRDGNNTSRCLDKGVVYARPQTTQVVTGKGASCHAILLPEIGMHGSVDKASHPQPQNHGKPQTVTQNQKMEPPSPMVQKVVETTPPLFGHGHCLLKGAGGGGSGVCDPRRQHAIGRGRQLPCTAIVPACVLVMSNTTPTVAVSVHPRTDGPHLHHVTIWDGTCTSRLLEEEDA